MSVRLKLCQTNKLKEKTLEKEKRNRVAPKALALTSRYPSNLHNLEGEIALLSRKPAQVFHNTHFQRALVWKWLWISRQQQQSIRLSVIKLRAWGPPCSRARGAHPRSRDCLVQKRGLASVCYMHRWINTSFWNTFQRVYKLYIKRRSPAATISVSVIDVGLHTQFWKVLDCRGTNSH